MTRKSKVLIVFIVIIFLGLAGYIFIWDASNKILSRQVDALWNSMENSGAKIVGDKPQVRGFPGKPRLEFSGSITEFNGTQWEIPQLIYSGFPLPSSDLHFQMPQGFVLSGPLMKRTIKIDEVTLNFTIPIYLPSNGSREEIEVWQKNGGHFPINLLKVRAGPTDMLAAGHIKLDERLQIAGELQARVEGMDVLLADLTEQGVLKGTSAMTAQNFLRMLMEKDPATGKEFFPTTITIQKNGIFIGPLRVGSLPELTWSSGNQPDPRQ